MATNCNKKKQNESQNNDKMGASLVSCLADLFQLLIAKRDPVPDPAGLA